MSIVLVSMGFAKPKMELTEGIYECFEGEFDENEVVSPGELGHYDEFLGDLKIRKFEDQLFLELKPVKRKRFQHFYGLKDSSTKTSDPGHINVEDFKHIPAKFIKLTKYKRNKIVVKDRVWIKGFKYLFKNTKDLLLPKKLRIKKINKNDLKISVKERKKEEVKMYCYAPKNPEYLD